MISAHGGERSAFGYSRGVRDSGLTSGVGGVGVKFDMLCRRGDKGRKHPETLHNIFCSAEHRIPRSFAYGVGGGNTLLRPSVFVCGVGFEAWYAAVPFLGARRGSFPRKSRDLLPPNLTKGRACGASYILLSEQGSHCHS